jgi:hypothetical protein
VTGQDRVSVGCGAWGAQRSNGATGAADILHHEFLAKITVEDVGDDPAGDVGRPAGCERTMIVHVRALSQRIAPVNARESALHACGFVHGGHNA